MLRPFDPNLPISLLPLPSGNRNDDTAHLLDFIDRLYHPHIETSFYVQTQICMGLIMFLALPTSCVVLHRIFHGRAWFLKIWHVAGGTFVIPNAVMAFLLCQAAFATVWLVYAYLTLRYYRWHSFQEWYLLYKILVWVPLWVGGWWTAFGVLSAFPDALTSKSKGGRPKRLILSPLAFNIACWFAPFVQLASILPPAILAARKHNSSLGDFQVWRKLAETAQKGVISEATFSTLRSDALGLWLDVTKAYWYLAVAFTCWDVWAIICLIVYVPVGAHTLSRIRAQLKIARMKEQAVNPVINIMLAGEGAKDAGDLEDPQRSQGVGTTTSRVFPPMKDTAAPVQARPVPCRTLEQRRYQTLQKLYKNLFVQYCGICIAIACFFASSSIYAVRAYDSARNNDIAPIQVESNLSASWVMVVFGGLIVLCIFWRSFDPSLSIDVSDEEPSPLAPRSLFEALKKHALSVGKFKRKTNSGRRLSSTDEENVVAPDILPARSHNVSFVGPDETHSGQTSVGNGSRSCAKLEITERTVPVSCGTPSSTSSASTGSHGWVPAPANAELESSVVSAAVFYATPFGKVPASKDGHSRGKSDITRHRSVSPDEYEELNTARSHRSLVGKAGSLHKPSISSFTRWRQTRSMSSVSSINTLAASQYSGQFGKFDTSAPSPSEIIEMSRSDSVPEGAGHTSTSSIRSSSCDPDPEMVTGFTRIDMDAPCFVPPGVPLGSTHHKIECPESNMTISRGGLQPERTLVSEPSDPPTAKTKVV